ncbi:hypothetical protein JL720_15482 [Aureococcus anophagefferens]|nr:hypothetical protein JL720_15482 [Aureococcus anophagefferens]
MSLLEAPKRRLSAENSGRDYSFENLKTEWSKKAESSKRVPFGNVANVASARSSTGSYVSKRRSSMSRQSITKPPPLGRASCVASGVARGGVASAAPSAPGTPPAVSPAFASRPKLARSPSPGAALAEARRPRVASGGAPSPPAARGAAGDAARRRSRRRSGRDAAFAALEAEVGALRRETVAARDAAAPPAGDDAAGLAAELAAASATAQRRSGAATPER